MKNLLAKSNLPYIYFLGLGFSGVGSISLHVFGWLPLHLCALLLVAPAMAVGSALLAKDAELRSVVIRGLLFGILSVFLYDLSRLPFLMMGWGDFIPKIGQWLFVSDQPVSPLIGYAWRYLLNGGGLGVAFLMLQKLAGTPKYKWLSGVNFGLFVFFGLLMTLIVAPHGQSIMFKITMISFWGGLVGHIIYGFTLGVLVSKTAMFAPNTLRPAVS